MGRVSTGFRVREPPSRWSHRDVAGKSAKAGHASPAPVSRCAGIAGWHNLGLAPEEIAAKMERLTLAQIHAALAYYHANRDEIGTDIAAEDVVVEQPFPAQA